MLRRRPKLEIPKNSLLEIARERNPKESIYGANGKLEARKLGVRSRPRPNLLGDSLGTSSSLENTARDIPYILSTFRDMPGTYLNIAAIFGLPSKILNFRSFRDLYLPRLRKSSRKERSSGGT